MSTSTATTTAASDGKGGGGGGLRRNRPIYGQVVVGAPGSGKTTYCNGMQQYLRLLGRREAVWVINLDPANESSTTSTSTTSTEDPGSTTAASSSTSSSVKTKTKKPQQQQQQQQQSASGGGGGHELPYDTLFDVCKEVVNLSSLMKETGLGPNGGLLYCMEYLEAHVNDICEMIQSRIVLATTTEDSSSSLSPSSTSSCYLLLDLPGQVELFTHSTCVQRLLQKLILALDLRLTAVQLMDALYCTDASKFLSASLLATTTMLRLELPMVSILSKVDLLSSMGGSGNGGGSDNDDSAAGLDFHLDFYTECHDLNRLVPFALNVVERRNHRGNHGNIDPETLQDILEQDANYQRARQKRQSSSFYRKFSRLHEGLAEVITDFGLLQFVPLDITNAASVGRVLAKVDKCNGYVFVNNDQHVAQDLFQCAIQQESSMSAYESIADIQERISSSNNLQVPTRSTSSRKQPTSAREGKK
jgi:GPN-loop GTPase